MRCLDTKAVTEVFEKLFKTFGIPEKVRTDGGPKFRGEFKNWCEEWGIEHVTSSPHHHQSNCHAEQAAHQLKNLLKKAPKDLGRALLEFRNIPRVPDGLSPA